MIYYLCKNKNKMRKIFTLIILLLFINMKAQNVQEKYSKVKISLVGKNIEDLAKLGLEVDHGIIVKGRYLINDFSSQELNQIATANFSYEILIDDVIAWYQDQNREHLHSKASPPPPSDCFTNNTSSPTYETPVNYTYGSMGGYVTYSEMLEVLDSMYSKFPNLITQRAPIGTTADTTWMGNRIQWLKISDNPNIDEAEPEVLFTSLHHAREPNSLSQNLFYMWYLLENYATDSEIAYLVNETEIYFIPCVNPDGYLLNEQSNANGGGMVRKNARDNDNNGIYNNQDGVDLNRNYGHEWGYDNTGSSNNPSSQTYRGIAAFSEPETRAVRDFCNAREIQITLNYHTYGNLLIHPWGYTDVITSEHETFRMLGLEMTQYNHFTFGTGSETVGYTVNGDSDDWMYGETVSKGRIYSMTPEIGTQSDGFWPLSSDIDNLNKSVMHQNLSVSRLVLNYVEGIDLSANDILNASGTLAFEFVKKGLMAGDVTVAFNSLNPNLNITFSPQILSLQHLQTAQVNPTYVVDPNTLDNTELKFVVSVNNGLHTYYDTIVKTYFSETISLVYEDHTNNLSQWYANGWEITTSEFYSSPNCITESANGNYSANQDNRITLTQYTDLTYSSYADISFWAKWDIENNYDFTEVLISIDSGSNFIPLCGQFTNEGTANQDVGMPLYDGVQADWVHESIDISEYVGHQVIFQFYFHSDQFENGDGFYFDDFEVHAINLAHEHHIDITNYTCFQDSATISIDTFSNQWNLDSIITTTTIYIAAEETTINLFTADEDSVGISYDTLQNSYGCDSIIVTHRTYQTAIGVDNNILLENNIKIYPNPLKEILFIETKNLNTSFQIEILNTIGQTLESYNISEKQGKISKNISYLENGIYFIRVTVGQKTEVFRFLKM